VGAYDGIGAEVVEDHKGLFILAELVVALGEKKEGLFVVRGEVGHFTEVADGFFVFLEFVQGSSQVAANGEVFRLAFMGDSQELDRPFHVASAVFEVAEVVVHVEFLVVDGAGDHKGFVRFIVLFELKGGESKPGCDEAFVYVGVGGGEVHEDSVGLHGLFPGLFVVVEFGDALKGVVVPGVGGELFVCLFEDGVAVFALGGLLLFSGTSAFGSSHHDEAVRQCEKRDNEYQDGYGDGERHWAIIRGGR